MIMNNLEGSFCVVQFKKKTTGETKHVWVCTPDSQDRVIEQGFAIIDDPMCSILQMLITEDEERFANMSIDCCVDRLVSFSAERRRRENSQDFLSSHTQAQIDEVKLIGDRIEKDLISDMVSLIDQLVARGIAVTNELAMDLYNHR